MGPLFLLPPNNLKPYFYYNRYFIFYGRGNKVYYRSLEAPTFPVTLTTCGIEVSPFKYSCAIMARDDIVYVTYFDPTTGEIKSKWGTIQPDGSIVWTTPRIEGIDTRNRHVTNYTTIWSPTGQHMLYSKAGYTQQDQLDYWNKETGAGGPLTYCDADLGNWWFQTAFIPYENMHNMDVLWSRAGDLYLNMRSRAHDGLVCQGRWSLPFYNAGQIEDQAYGVLLPDRNEIHIIYSRRTPNRIHHWKKTYNAVGSLVGIVRDGMAADHGVTICYDKNTLTLYLFWWEDTTIYYRTWTTAGGYSPINTLISGETDILHLTAYPYVLDGKILLVWEALGTIRFYVLSV